VKLEDSPYAHLADETYRIWWWLTVYTSIYK
jgi:hypothetical protein